MAENFIAPIMPNMSAQAEAVAGSSAAIFTATDRKIIEELGGSVEQKRSFVDVFKNKPLNAKVENQETSVKPGVDTKEIENRRKDHQKILRHSVISVPRERVQISAQEPDTFEHKKVPAVVDSGQDKKTTKQTDNRALQAKTIEIVKELQLDPGDILDKFNLEQKELLSLVSSIKELHLKRLLTEDYKEFISISDRIEKITLRSAKTEAREWWKDQLKKLSRGAIEYKVKFEKSMLAMDQSPERRQIIEWLQKILDRLS